MHCVACPPRLDREDPINGYHHDFNEHHKPDGRSGAIRVAMKGTGRSGGFGVCFWRCFVFGVGTWGLELRVCAGFRVWDG